MNEDFCDCGQYCTMLSEDGLCCICQKLETIDLCSECKETVLKEEDQANEAPVLTIEKAIEVKEVFYKNKGGKNQ